MMRSIVGSSMKFQFLVITLAAALMIFGVTRLRAMPVDSLPEFSPPYVEIQTEALGLSAKEVEQMITVPMEQDLLAGVAWLDVIESKSVPGLSSVVVYFEPGTDLYRARQMVAERIAQSAVGLPHVSKPPTMIQPLSSASRFMIVGLSSKDLSLIDLSVLARWTIAPRLMGVPGVAHVAIWGNRERQLQVLIDPQKLQEQGVTLDQVVETTGNALWVSPLSFLEASSPGTGGFIDTPNQRLGLWHVLPISSPDDLAQVPVEGAEGLQLKDVAQVVEDHQPLIGDAIIEDSPSLLLVIEKLPEINTLEVTHGVEEALGALGPGLPGVQFDSSLFRPATFIEQAMANLSQSLLIAALLVMLVLAAFLYGWRSALISLISIIVSLFAALLVLYVRGSTLNVMVLAGLVVALGIVIDDAVVDIDHVLRHLRRNRAADTPASAQEIILAASSEMRGSILFATLITLLAVLPVFLLDGMTGALFRPLAMSYSLAVIASMVVALTLTPALSMLLLSGSRLEMRASPLIPRLQHSYEGMLNRTVGSPAAANIILVVLIVAGLAVVPFLSRDPLMPAFREPYVLVDVEGAPATSQPEMSRILGRMSAELRGLPGVQDVGAHVGRAIYGDEVVGINSASLWIGIAPGANYDATVAAIREVAGGYIGMSTRVQTYLEQSLTAPNEMRPAGDLTLRVYGEDMKTLQVEADKLSQSMNGITGVTRSRVMLPVEEPTLEIEVDLAAAQKYGIKPGEVRRTAATVLSGILVGSLFEQQKVFDVVVWGTPDIRRNVSDIQEIMIQTPDGGQVRLGDVANVRIVSAPTVIQHASISPYLDIAVDVSGRSLSAVAVDMRSAAQAYPFPLEYHAEVLDAYNARQGIQLRILIAGIAALLGIFLLMQAATRSWRLAFSTFLVLPAALVGGLLAAFISGGAISLASLFGLLTILGITARNGISLINHYQNLETEDGQVFGRDLIMRGSRERLAPILMTALATAVALLPFVIFGAVPGLEMVHPMAIVILGGLVTSTLVNLFAIPALYMGYGASREADLGLMPIPVTHPSGAQD